MADRNVVYRIIGGDGQSALEAFECAAVAAERAAERLRATTQRLTEASQAERLEQLPPDRAATSEPNPDIPAASHSDRPDSAAD